VATAADLRAEAQQLRRLVKHASADEAAEKSCGWPKSWSGAPGIWVTATPPISLGVDSDSVNPRLIAQRSG